jgi:hypothetical protein
MAGFATMDDIVAEVVTNGKRFLVGWTKVFPDPGGSSDFGWVSGWKGAGSPSAGSDPATTPGTAYTSTPSSIVTGSIPLPDLSPQTKHILRIDGAAGTVGTQGAVMVYDRLYGVSGISLTSTGNKTLNNGTISLPRYTTGQNVIPVMEVTTAGTTTAAVVSLSSYTNQDGASGSSGGSFTFPTTTPGAGNLHFLPLAADDCGCREVTTLNVATAATALIVNVLLIKPLMFLPILQQWIATEMYAVIQSLSLPRIYDGACIGLAFCSSASSATTIVGSLEIGYG